MVASRNPFCSKEIAAAGFSAASKLSDNGQETISMPEKLKDGDSFPSLTVNTVAHGAINLPGDLHGEWSVLLFYRGWW